MSLAPGARLGPYEVLSSLGAGGMGEVYRARDTRLKRDVALKILPESFAADPERLARFQREAEVLASLNHPHIAAIYGLEDSHGVRALVMELVEGPTLAERIAQGAIPLDEALRVARQIAEALEAAHEQGVIHRDLKPANIKVRSDGTVKVLDFGLAKALERAPAAAGPVSMSPTITTPAVMTGVGVMLGTAAYMSPEQARGQVVDRRADIWSFGCVLYELLTRHPPFPGPTVPDMIAAILDRDPDWTLLPSHTPVGIVRVIQRCLRKDPARRLHHVADVRIEIDEALQAPAMTVATAVFDTTRLQRKAARWKLATAVLATVALVSLFAAAWARVRPVAGTAASGPVLTQVARLTHDPQLSEWPTWSPDRSVIAFASNRSGNFEVYVRRVEGGQDVNVTESPAEDLQPAFSPDGKSIAFVSTRSSRTTTVKIGSTSGMEFRTFGGDIWVLPALGGRARRLAPDGNVPVWDPAGGVIAYVSGPENHRSILTVPAEGGTVTPVLTSEASTWEIVRVQYSPDGRWVSFDTANPERIFVMPVAGGSPHELLSGIYHVWDPTSARIYYLAREPLGGTGVRWVSVDPATGMVHGSPQTVGVMTGLLRDLVMSRDGTQLAASELEGSMNLTRLPLSPDGGAPAGPEELLSTGQTIDRYPSWSPDGTRVAYASARLGRLSIWTFDLSARQPERVQLTGDDVAATLPFWMPDSRQLTFTRTFKDGTNALWLAAVDGSHSEELVPGSPGLFGSPVSPDNRIALYSARDRGYLQLFALDLRTKTTRQLTSSPDDKIIATWSPDLRWIAYVSNATGSLQLWRIPSSGGAPQQLTTGNDRVHHPFYSADGRWIYAQPNHQNIYRMPAAGGALQPVTKFPVSGLFIEEPVISPDGRYLLYSRSTGGSSLWVLTLGNRAGDVQTSR